jgi:hypothetical protein
MDVIEVNSVFEMMRACTEKLNLIYAGKCIMVGGFIGYC